jgi:hypothetical protein
MKTVWFLALWFCTDDVKCESYDQLKNQPRQAFQDISACQEKMLDLENSGAKIKVNGQEYWLVGTCVDKRK